MSSFNKPSAAPFIRERHHRQNGVLYLFIALLLITLLPTLAWMIPPAMVDYPNHLARMFLLSDNHAISNPFYEIRWALYPNLAMDMMVPALAKWIGAEAATRMFYLASQLLVVSGAAALEYSIKRRLELAPFVPLMFLFSLPFVWGFLNFEFAMGCALWGIAVYHAACERSWAVRTVIHTLVSIPLFVSHLFAFGIYGFTVGVYELWRAYSKRSTLGELARRLASIAVPALILIAVAKVAGGSVGGSGTKWNFAGKLFWVVHIMNGYSLLASAASVAAVIFGGWRMSRSGYLQWQGLGAWLGIAFAILYLLMPWQLFDTSFVDLRVIVAAALIVPSALRLKFPNSNVRHATLVVVSAVIVVNAAVVTSVWASYRADYEAAKRSFARLPKYATVLIAHSGRGDDPPIGYLTEYPMYQVPVLAVHYASAFVPNLFTENGKQPVTVRPQWQRLDIPYGGPVPVALLQKIAENGALGQVPPFIRTWLEDFDYLYLLGPKIENPMPRFLDKITEGPRFVLYRIHKLNNLSATPN